MPRGVNWETGKGPLQSLQCRPSDAWMEFCSILTSVDTSDASDETSFLEAMRCSTMVDSRCPGTVSKTVGGRPCGRLVLASPREFRRWVVVDQSQPAGPANGDGAPVLACRGCVWSASRPPGSVAQLTCSRYSSRLFSRLSPAGLPRDSPQMAWGWAVPMTAATVVNCRRRG
jgi:hypothetical protein